MKRIAGAVVKGCVLFMAGGGLYCLFEIAWRGRTHPSMLFVGGLCFILIGSINNIFSWSLGMVWQCLIGAALVTAVELVSGLILNVWLGLGVWDYSNMPLNLMGQICLPYSLLWILLSAGAIVLDDYLRYWLFGEEKPRYVAF